MVLGTLVFPVLIARGGVAISMMWVAVLFIPGPVWVDFLGLRRPTSPGLHDRN